MSSASFYSAIKPDAKKTAESERDLVRDIFNEFIAPALNDRDEYLVEAKKAGYDKVRVIKVTVEVEDELAETGTPDGETVQ